MIQAILIWVCAHALKQRHANTSYLNVLNSQPSPHVQQNTMILRNFKWSASYKENKPQKGRITTTVASVLHAWKPLLLPGERCTRKRTDFLRLIMMTRWTPINKRTLISDKQHLSPDFEPVSTPMNGQNLPNTQSSQGRAGWPSEARAWPQQWQIEVPDRHKHSWREISDTAWRVTREHLTCIRPPWHNEEQKRK